MSPRQRVALIAGPHSLWNEHRGISGHIQALGGLEGHLGLPRRAAHESTSCHHHLVKRHANWPWPTRCEIMPHLLAQRSSQR